MHKIVSNRKINFDAKKEAFQYQAEAFETLRDLDYSAIFHEQGLGKTKIAIDLILYWLQKRDIDTVLVVTKKQLIKNWQDEFLEHTYIIPKILSNNKKNNYYVLNSPTKVVVTNFETLSTDKNRLLLFLKSRNVAIIIDESTKIKNPDSKLTKDFFDLSPYFKIKTIMTGTPVANRPYDIWSQVYFLDAGNSLGDDFNEFKRKTNLRNDFNDNEFARQEFENEVSKIFSRISSFSVRETKDSCGIELPKKIYETIIAKAEDNQNIMYEKIINEYCLEISNNGTSYFDDDTVALKRLLRLNQIASNPKLVDPNYKYISGKEKELDILIQEIINNGEKCIIWSIYIDNVEYFANKYSKYNARVIHGSMDMCDRNTSVDMFKNDESCKLLFATPQAAKEGLTLTVANNVIFYDRGFNLDDYLQAQDRIHRISQKKVCKIYKIILQDSIDLWIEKLLNAKQYAAFLAQGDINKEDYKISIDYSYGDIIKEILLTEGENDGKNN